MLALKEGRPSSAPRKGWGLKGLALTLIAFYQQHISPQRPPSCRFSPTCSQYGYEAVERHGLVRGGLLTLWRLLRCHPWHPGGYDPVP